MPLSFYIKTFPFEDKKDHRLVYSTKKGSISILPEEMLARAEQDRLLPEETQALERIGVVCRDRESELADVASLMDRLNSKKTGMSVTTVLNLDCNFDCVYCYEGSLKGNRYMTEETADSLIAFVRSRFVPGMRHITFNFYGGEPLLSMPVIRRISSAMLDFASGKGAKYSFTLVSNGSLFTRRIASELAGLGLTAIKTTLDGPERLHNRLRPFKGGGGSFSSIVRNLKETSDLVKVGVGGNFQRDDYMEFPELLDYLASGGLTPERLHQVKFDPVMPRQEGFGTAGDFVEGCMSINEPWLIEASIYLREAILSRGYDTLKITPMPCQVELDDTCVVNYDGTLCKCPAFLGIEGLSSGNVSTGVGAYKESNRVGLWKTPECLGCGYLPLCFGGCRYMSYLRTGSLSPDCKKAYLDATLEAFVRQDVRYRKRTGDPK